ncbi:histidine kinase dimerization/phosphoacceptor domain -containing protein [Phaeovulum sp.]|uniref:histidine kinase dimerization/phosphoacceptor domain -containing protein n=1 Tax=Phaeovulum sp. TaxID=2934796 RepID=UPI0039E217A1
MTRWRRFQRRVGRLGFRFVFLLALALTPLVIISILNGNAVVKEARKRSQAALVGETLRAATPQLNLILRAEGATEALAQAVPVVMANPALCETMMRRMVASNEVFTFAGFYDTNGKLRCSSVGAGQSLVRDAAFEKMLANPVPTLNVNTKAPISGVSVVYTSWPVRDDQGGLTGFVSVSLPHSALLRPPAPTDGRKYTLLTFERTGEILTSSSGLEDAQNLLPRDRPLSSFINTPAQSFTASSISGRDYMYTVVPLIPGVLYALGAWSAEAHLGGHSMMSPALFPALMALASLVVAWLVANRLVTRHILALRRQIVTFAAGDRLGAEGDYTSAPLEVRQIADAFASMTVSVMRDEAVLEDAIHQKEVLLREVHHRVKNNLQLIASIMNMQSRKAISQEAKALMRSLQDRVMSLATIHKGLYQTSGLADVRARELLEDIIRQVLSMASGADRHFDVTTDFDDLRLPPDLAVPLALLVTEGVTNAVKHARDDAIRTPQLDVTLHEDGAGSAVLRICNSVADGSPPASTAAAGLSDGSGLGGQLMQAFVMQLGGTLQRNHANGSYEVVITFPLRLPEDTPPDEAAIPDSPE